MAQAGGGGGGAGGDDTEIVKSEVGVQFVKREQEAAAERRCAVCGAGAGPGTGAGPGAWSDAYWSKTLGTSTPLVAYVCRVAGVRPAGQSSDAWTGEGVATCRACVDLVNRLETAELEYYRLRDEFLALVSTSSAFEPYEARDVSPVREDNEACERTVVKFERDSDDEPLLVMRSKRGRRATKQKNTTQKSKPKPKRRVDAVDDTECTCTECGEVLQNKTEATVHMLVVHRGSYEVSVKEEDECHRKASSKMYELEDEPHFADDDDEWIPTKEEPADEDFDLTIKKKINSKKKRSYVRTKSKTVSIPVMGELPSQLVVKDSATSIDQENVSKINEKMQKRKYTKSEPKSVHPCKECDATFRSLKRLTHHMARHEMTKGPFICEVCGAHYKHKKACDIHVMMHKGISDWKCEECNKLFPSKGALQRHNAIHTGKPNYQCDLCGKSFIHTSSFKMHKLSHSGVKPHSCDVCGLALMTRSHLKRHKRIHSGEKRHECAHCGKKFSERYNLLAHQKSHNTVPGLPKPRVAFMFRCSLCDNRFERRYMLEKHMEGVHQRVLERGPAKPRNTMTKLLKAQAAAANKTVNTNGSEGTSEILRNALIKAAIPEEVGIDIKPVLIDAEGNDKEKTKMESPGRTSSGEASLAYDGGVRPVGPVWTSNTYIAADYVRASLPTFTAQQEMPELN